MADFLGHECHGTEVGDDAAGIWNLEGDILLHDVWRAGGVASGDLYERVPLLGGAWSDHAGRGGDGESSQCGVWISRGDRLRAHCGAWAGRSHRQSDHGAAGPFICLAVVAGFATFHTKQLGTDAIADGGL